MTNTILIKEEVIIFTWLKHNLYMVKTLITNFVKDKPIHMVKAQSLRG